MPAPSGGGIEGGRDERASPERTLDAASRRLGYDFSHNLRYEAIRRHVIAFGLRRLLVLGCGRGVLESVLPAGIETVSVDIARERLEIARALNAGSSSRRFVELDLMQAADTLGRGAFDGVILSEVIEHLAHDVAALAVGRDCLAPRGILIVTVPNTDRLVNAVRRRLGLHPRFMGRTHLREYTRESLHRALGTAGFEILSTEMVALCLPKESLVQRLQLLAPRHPLRTWMLRRWPHLGTYLLALARANPG